MNDPTMAAEVKPGVTLIPRQVAEARFSNLEQNKLSDAQALLDENVLWENIPLTPGVSDWRRGWEPTEA
jgi:hypothetical protein